MEGGAATCGKSTLVIVEGGAATCGRYTLVFVEGGAATCGKSIRFGRSTFSLWRERMQDSAGLLFSLWREGQHLADLLFVLRKEGLVVLPFLPR